MASLVQLWGGCVPHRFQTQLLVMSYCAGALQRHTQTRATHKVGSACINTLFQSVVKFEEALLPGWLMPSYGVGRFMITCS